MKENRPINTWFFAFLRISFLQVFLAFFLAGESQAFEAKMQNVLGEKINLDVEDQTISKVLKQIEKQADVKFVFSSALIQADRTVSIHVKDELLNEVLDYLFIPLELNYEIAGKNIIVRRNKLGSLQNAFPHQSLVAFSAAGKIITNPQELLAFTVTGKVIDENNEPLPGVNVLLKGTTTGTTTDPNGDFTLTVPDGNGTLVFSFIGYANQEIPINNRSTINVTLVSDTKALQEVVVIGYGTQKKGEVTSAVTKIDAEQFNKGNISDVSRLLQGKVAGLSIARPGGDPNARSSIRLRGLSTLGANTQPLVVIDGQIGADLNTVDPNDIKSVDVLKDAASAAIYGTRGSAGVIIITTNSGTVGPPQLAYNGFVTAEDPARFTPNMTADEYRALGKGTDYGSNTNWYDEISRTAMSHTHNLSLSGGSVGTTYNASVNYRDFEGVAINTGFKQLNGRLNLIQKALKDKLVLNVNLNTTRRASQLGFPEAFKYAAIFNPTAPIRTNDPLYDLTGSGYFESNFVDYANPVAVMEQNTNDQELKRLNITGSAEYEIVRGLKFLVRYAQQNISNYRWAYFPRNSFHSRNLLGVSGFARGGFAFKADEESFNQLYENTLSYTTNISTLNISAIGGYSYQDFLNKGFSVRAGNFLTDVSAENLNTAQDFKEGRAVSNSYKNGSRLVAFFGRLNLNYNDIAFLTASLRREGSTQFGENNKWGMFPAVSAGFDLSRIITIPGVDNLKFRASYGVTGALPPMSYLSLPTLSPSTSSFYAGNNRYLPSYGPDKNPNPDLKWERKGEFDAGVDFALLDNRLTGTADYYVRTTSDLIFNVTVPVPPNLVPTTWLNIGELKSSGFELALGYDILRGGAFTWNSSGNLSTYSVKLASLDPSLAGSYVGATNLGTPGQEATQITRAVQGERIGILWGYIYDGVDEGGKYKFRDLNDDGKINDNDRTQIGNGLPKFEFGWSNTFKYRNFDFNFFLRGSLGHDIINTYRAFYENPNVASSYNVVKTKYFNPNITDGQLFSSLFVERASFVKLDNATLGYNFSFPQSSAFKTLRVYVTGQNLFLITDYTGVDPEVRYSDTTNQLSQNSLNPGLSDNALAPGVDRRETWVFTRSYTLGLNLGF